jgi:glucose/arabinose dehydrogenase
MGRNNAAYWVIGLMLLLGACDASKNAKPADMNEKQAVNQVEPRKVSATIVVEGLDNPWGMAFLPNDAGILITEKYGGVRLFAQGKLQAVPGAPNTLAEGEAGLMDIALDPDFSSNARVYLSFAEGDRRRNQVSVFAARYQGGQLIDGRVIYRSPSPKSGSGHSGSRILLLPDKTLLLSIGDGFDRSAEAQDRRSSLGKIIRLTREGQPVAGSLSGVPGLFSMGHRNIEGLALDAATGAIWATEHGPKGGDELNAIKDGANYGWPKTTYGFDSDGRYISRQQEAQGITDPVITWVPSIAPSGLAIYRGKKFPGWDGDLLVGALAGRQLRRIKVNQNGEQLQEVLLREMESRVRDVRVSPAGDIYVLTDGNNGKLRKVIYSSPS